MHFTITPDAKDRILSLPTQALIKEGIADQLAFAEKQSKVLNEERQAMRRIQGLCLVRIAEAEHQRKLLITAAQDQLRMKQDTHTLADCLDIIHDANNQYYEVVTEAKAGLAQKRCALDRKSQARLARLQEELNAKFFILLNAPLGDI